MMKDRWIKRRELQDRLTRETMCHIQHTGWPCNTCFHAIELPALVLEIIGGDSGNFEKQVHDATLYQEKIHELWLSVLLFRGDYKRVDIPQTKEQTENNIEELLKYLRLKQGAYLTVLQS